MQEWDKDKFVVAAHQDHRVGAANITEFDKHFNLAMKNLTLFARSWILPRQQENLGTDSLTSSTEGTQDVTRPWKQGGPIARSLRTLSRPCV